MEKTRKITFERIPELTKEEQEVLDAIKIGLRDVEEGRVLTIEEVERRILKNGKINWQD